MKAPNSAGHLHIRLLLPCCAQGSHWPNSLTSGESRYRAWKLPRLFPSQGRHRLSISIRRRLSNLRSAEERCKPICSVPSFSFLLVDRFSSARCHGDIVWKHRSRGLPRCAWHVPGESLICTANGPGPRAHGRNVQIRCSRLLSNHDIPSREFWHLNIDSAVATLKAVERIASVSLNEGRMM
jgi:hypothetical protein